MYFSTLTLATTLLSLATAAPTSLDARWPGNLEPYLTPSSISIYHGFDGSITPKVARGEVSRQNWSGRDNSTLVTFDIRPITTTTPCSLKFFIDPTDSSAIVTGTGLVDIFSSFAPAPAAGSNGWGPPGNQRNLPLGRLRVVRGGFATFVPDVPSPGNSFTCPKLGNGSVTSQGLVGYEVVPVGDNVRVEWDVSKSGLLLKY